VAVVRFLLDTNVISELRKPRRDQRVAEWIASVTTENAFISVITIGEITKGIAKRRRTASGNRDADNLESWLDGLLAMYADRILPVDVPVAARWGRLCNEHSQLATDMLLAATALEHGLTVATRNVDHFDVAGVPTLNPFG
jgi:predicted nucleic acid-binding protein